MSISPTISARSHLLPAAVLVAMTLAAFSRAPWLDYVNYDDPGHITNNSMVKRGLSREGVVWAFKSHEDHWHPLTWLSQMLMVQLFGIAPGPHHVANVLLHCASVVVLFSLLVNTTSQTWPSFVVAALFAVHPLRVESVAWIAERRDVLSTLLWLITTSVYVRYTRHGGMGLYCATLVCFALGLMAKSMLVTLPLILLLADYWPLRRFGSVPTRRLVLEKLPLLLLSAADSVMAIWAQHSGGAMVSLEALPVRVRLANAVCAYGSYIGKFFFPRGLANPYPYKLDLPLWQFTVSAIVLILCSAFAIVRRRQSPYVLVGWLWYLIALLPVIGLFQSGTQAMADRYTYVPQIGLAIALVWSVYEAVAPSRLALRTATVLAAIVLIACVGATWVQMGYWKNSFTLFKHAVTVTRDNSIAQINYGRALAAAHQPEQAIEQLKDAIRSNPGNPDAYNSLGIVYTSLSRYDEAEQMYREALEVNPHMAPAAFNWGNLLDKQGRTSEAVEKYKQAVSEQPDLAEAWNNYGTALVKLGDPHLAIDKFEHALRLNPDHAAAHYNLGVVLEGLGMTQEAATHYRDALRVRPDYEKARTRLNNLLDRQ